MTRISTKRQSREVNKTMIWYYGDIHGNADGLFSRLRNADVKLGDTVVLLGDVGLNYHKDQSLASISIY